jgi:hypothetical protein
VKEKLHLVAKKNHERTCCGWETRGRAAQVIVAGWCNVPMDQRCKICDSRQRFGEQLRMGDVLLMFAGGGS